MPKLCKCPVCDCYSDEFACTVEIKDGKEEYFCNNCRRFILPDIEHERLKKLSNEERGNLSGYICEKNGDMDYTVEFSDDMIDDILNDTIIADTLIKKVDKLLLFVYNHQSDYGMPVHINCKPALLYVNTKNAWERVFRNATASDYISHHGIEHIGNKYVSLTDKGITRCEQLRQQLKSTDSNVAFIAMCFNNGKVDPNVRIEIKSAVTACGFKPIIVDEIPHIQDINEFIETMIRSCKFLIADLTENRGGVYYEAGFARGLGKQVILTCKTGKGIKNPHFDVNHINIIFWKNEEELKKLLIDRIKATIH